MDILIGFEVWSNVVLSRCSARITSVTLAQRSRPGPDGLIAYLSSARCERAIQSPLAVVNTRCTVAVDGDPPVKRPTEARWWAIRAPTRALLGCECFWLSCEGSLACHSCEKIMMGSTLLCPDLCFFQHLEPRRRSTHQSLRVKTNWVTTHDQGKTQTPRVNRRGRKKSSAQGKANLKP